MQFFSYLCGVFVNYEQFGRHTTADRGSLEAL